MSQAHAWDETECNIFHCHSIHSLTERVHKGPATLCSLNATRQIPKYTSTTTYTSTLINRNLTLHDISFLCVSVLNKHTTETSLTCTTRTVAVTASQTCPVDLMLGYEDCQIHCLTPSHLCHWQPREMQHHLLPQSPAQRQQHGTHWCTHYDHDACDRAREQHFGVIE